MALRPGSCLLMSSHFSPSPRSWRILASSSGDHLDCLFAGDSVECIWPPDNRLEGTEEAEIDTPVVEVPREGTEPCRETLGEADER